MTLHEIILELDKSAGSFGAPVSFATTFRNILVISLCSTATYNTGASRPKAT